MSQLRIFTKTAWLTMATVLLTGANLTASKSSAELQPSPKQLVDEVWQILNQNYVDGNFNQQDWKAVRQEYLSRSYGSKEQAYTAIQEMVSKLGDRYTQFFDPEGYKQLDTDISGNLTGVGIELAEDPKTNALIVVAPIEGTPAAIAGILPADILLKINGQATRGMKINEAVKQITGAAGTQVKLTIQRGDKELTYNLTRTKIDLHPVTSRVQPTAVGKVGYIRLPEFTETAPAEMRRTIQSLEKQKVEGYVLDLRSDPGGLLNASIDIAGMWLKQGPVVSLVNRNQVRERYETKGEPLTDKPLVVLVDNGSASASEILAGALQDEGRAVLVGTRTFGKGVVQAIQPLEDGSALKLTIAKYYTPKGRDINHVGVTPNVVVELTAAQQKALIKNRQLGTLTDPQYAKAITNLTQLIQAKTKQPNTQAANQSANLFK
ncbi:S41 family peptidase [Kovacikia minuta CCNUW1]|uniref:S41 family peptidase n=1 Tax=Kovacikia minuta TaxID=2931930 RepID=UPI001CCBF078|nr:S41 family peptidase [Kovacikia minuta]UBF28029.1 S41 family peptidase [Kovacikia minuta CCNUW1]